MHIAIKHHLMYVYNQRYIVVLGLQKSIHINQWSKIVIIVCSTEPYYSKHSVPSQNLITHYTL